ncbi:DNA-3-methyladenine glycosylase [compost metagenome]
MTPDIQSAIKHLCTHDPFLATVIAQTPAHPTLTPHTNYYHELISSIISQQLSVKAAATIQKRFKGLFNDTFPEPEQILKRNIEELRAVGLSYQKAGYIQDLARHILDGSVRFETLDQLSNDDIVAELTKVKGIGEWTVHMFLMFCMGRLDVLPVGDLGIRTGIMRLYGFETLPKTEAIRLVAEQHRWHPYESVASWYIWQSLDNAPQQ